MQKLHFIYIVIGESKNCIPRKLVAELFVSCAPLTLTQKTSFRHSLRAQNSRAAKTCTIVISRQPTLALTMANNQEPIANDPRTYLSAYITLVPSKDALIQLAGPVAAYMKEQSDPTVAAIYLTGGEFETRSFGV